MAHCEDLNTVRNTAEDDAIVSGTKPETALPFTMKRLNISRAGRAELVNRLEKM